MPSNPKPPFNPRPPRTSNVKEEIRKRGRSVEDYLQQAFVAAGRSWPPAPRIVAAEPSAGARHLEHVRSIGGRGAEGGRFADPYFALPLPDASSLPSVKRPHLLFAFF